MYNFLRTLPGFCPEVEGEVDLSEEAADANMEDTEATEAQSNDQVDLTVEDDVQMEEEQPVTTETEETNEAEAEKED